MGDQSEHDDTVDNTSSPGWDADLDLDDVKVDEVEAESDEVGGWGEDLDIDDAANEDADYASSNLKADEAVSRTYIVPVAGICPENRWCKNSAHAADHAAAGSFGSSILVLCGDAFWSYTLPLSPRYLACPFLHHMGLQCCVMATWLMVAASL